MADSEEVRRRRGPSHKLDDRIAAATLRVVSELGPAALTLDAIAREAGCSRSTLYRRGLTRDDLIVRSMARAIYDVEAGAVAQLRNVVERRVERVRNRDFVAVVLMLSGEALRGTELGKRYLAEVFEPLRGERLELLQAAVDRGELDPTTDLDLLVDLVTGGLIFRAAHRHDVEPDLAERMTALLIKGAGKREAE